MRKIKLLIVENHTSLADVMKVASSSEPGLEVVGVAGSAHQALRILGEAAPDVILMDIHLPDVSVLEAIPLALEKAPHAKVILLMDQDDVRYQKAAMDNGASASLRKDLIATDLVVMVRKVLESQKHDSVFDEGDNADSRCTLFSRAVRGYCLRAGRSGLY